MKKLYLAIIGLLFSCLLATVLSVLAYNKSGEGSSSDVEQLAAQVDSLVIRTADLENSMTTTVTATPVADTSTKTVAVKEEPKEEPAKVETKTEPKVETKTEPKVETKTEPKVETKTVTTKTVTGSSVNMRSNPTTSAPLITTLNKGAQVASDGQTSRDSGITFVKVSYNGTTGWVSQDYLK